MIDFTTTFIDTTRAVKASLGVVETAQAENSKAVATAAEARPTGDVVDVKNQFQSKAVDQPDVTAAKTKKRLQDSLAKLAEKQAAQQEAEELAGANSILKVLGLAPNQLV